MLALCLPFHPAGKGFGALKWGWFIVLSVLSVSVCPRRPHGEQQRQVRVWHVHLCTCTPVKLTLRKRRFLLPPSVCPFCLGIVRVCYCSTPVLVCSRKLHFPVIIFSQPAHVFSPVLSVVSMLCFQLLCIVWRPSWSLSSTWSCVFGEVFSQVTSASLPRVTPRSVG